jgi:hypothetical protein
MQRQFVVKLRKNKDKTRVRLFYFSGTYYSTRVLLVKIITNSSAASLGQETKNKLSLASVEVASKL